MSESVELVAQINAEWRLMLIPAEGRTARAWRLERLAGDAWQGQLGFIRSAKMLRWAMPLCGPIDEAAAAIIEALPPRVDINTGAPRKASVRKRNEPPAENLGIRGSAAVLPRVVKMVPGVCIICAADFTYPAQSSRTLTCSPMCARINLRARQRDYQARKAAEIAKAVEIADGAPVPREEPIVKAPAPMEGDAIAGYWKMFHPPARPSHLQNLGVAQQETD